jgi:hypothetical protein
MLISVSVRPGFTNEVLIREPLQRASGGACSLFRHLKGIG